MANPEHYKILKEGVVKWNAWRKENPGITPDLKKVNLWGWDLSGFNLRKALLRYATLNDINFNGANLEWADLAHVEGAVANLSGTNLVLANLSYSNLAGANLSGADLVFANLAGTFLDWAKFDGANFGETIFGKTNLHSATGLNTCTHEMPSTIDFRTLQTLQISGELPLAFLRGCGLPDHFIEYLPSLLNQSPIQFYSCFISYSTKDDEFAKRLHADLQSKGVRCWFAPEDIKGGKKLFDQIDQAIRIHDKLLLILSEQSMASEWVKLELRRTLAEEKRTGKRKLFPLRVVDMETLKQWTCFDTDSGKDLAVEVREYYIPDFTNWKDHDAYQKAFNRLMKDLKEETEQTTKDKKTMG